VRLEAKSSFGEDGAPSRHFHSIDGNPRLDSARSQHLVALLDREPLAFPRALARHEVVREGTGCASRRRILVDADAGKEAPRVRVRRRLPGLEAEEIASLAAEGLGQSRELAAPSE
jgi:hypothetical protein